MSKGNRHTAEQIVNKLRQATLECQIADYEVRAKRANVKPPDMSTIENIVRDIAGVLHRAASGDATSAIECRKILSDLRGSASTNGERETTTHSRKKTDIQAFVLQSIIVVRFMMK
jgi:hypothetical protein